MRQEDCPGPEARFVFISREELFAIKPVNTGNAWWAVFIFKLKFCSNAATIAGLGKVVQYQEFMLQRIIMQEIFTVIAYPVVWLICTYVLKIESGLAKLLISLTAAVLVYVLIGIRQSKKGEEKDDSN